MSDSALPSLPASALDQMFRTAYTPRRWSDRPVADETLRALHDLWKWGPTSANCSPARVVFVKSQEGKDRLSPCVASGNRDKIQAAPVTAIVGWDTQFYEDLPRLYPQADARAWFAGNPPLIEETGFRNSTLQGAYMILAARALGLDCGPMSGFDRAKVDAEFFDDGRIKSNFLCILGHGAEPRPVRNPRPAFDEVCSIE